MVDTPQGTPGAQRTQLGFVAPNAQPHAGRGVDTSGAFRATNEFRAAYAQLAQTLGRSGEEFERTAEFLATMRNNTQAQDQSFKYFTGLDNDLNEFTKKEGLDAQNGLVPFMDSAKQKRQEALDAAPNAQQRELISRDITPRTNLIITQASRHAAYQEKAYQDRIAGQRVGSFQGAVAAAPEDDNVFNESIDQTAGAVISKLTQNGMLHPNQEMMQAMTAQGGTQSNSLLASLPAEERGLAVDNIRRATAFVWQTRFNKLIEQGKAWKADELYQLNKDRQDYAGIHQDHKIDFEQKINTAMTHQGASMVTEAAINGTPIQVQGANLKGANVKPEIDDAIRGAMQDVEKELGHPLHISFDEARKFAAIESSGKPGPESDTGSYKGLYQMGFKEWGRYGKGADIYDPRANAAAFLRKNEAESEDFRSRTGRDPTVFDHYMIHQRGVTGHVNALRNPDKLEWEIMRDAEPGKGETWAKKTVWKNGPFNAETTTARQFNNFWQQKIGGTPRSINPGLPKLDSDNLDKGDNTLDKRLKEADRLSDQLAPGNTAMRENAEKAVESRWNRVKREFDSQIGAVKDQLTQRMIKSNGADWDTFIKTGDSKALYDQLIERDPEKAAEFRRTYHAYDTSLAKGRAQPTQDDLNYMGELSGRYTRDPEGFAKTDFSKDEKYTHMPPAEQLKVQELQRSAAKGEKIYEAVSNRIERNTKLAAEVAFGAIGQGDKLDKDVAAKVDHFNGYMISLVTQMERENGGKALDDDTIRKVAGRILRQVTIPPTVHGWPGILTLETGGGQGILFEQKRQRYIDEFKETYAGAEPSEEQINEALMSKHLGYPKSQGGE